MTGPVQTGYLGGMDNGDMSAAIGELVAEGWRVEWHDDNSAVLTKPKKTPGQAFARGGLIGMAFNERNSKKPEQVRLTLTESGVQRDYS